MKEEARLFKALADPIRLRVAILLAVRGETCVGDLAEALGEADFKISRHLSVLRSARLVEVRRDGTWMFYRLAEPKNLLERSLQQVLRTEMAEHPVIVEDVAKLTHASGDERKAQKSPAQIERQVRVLFLGTGNACRSQMAEAWAKTLKSHEMEVFSAGIEKQGLSRRAVRVMAEAGVDISGYRSKTVGELPNRDFDFVITLSNAAHVNCPRFPGNPKINCNVFDDPPALAEGSRDDAEALSHYRRVRDEIRAFVEALPEALQTL